MKKSIPFALLFVVLIGVIFVTVICNSSYATTYYQMPRWIKILAGWYATDQISDGEFTQAVQYMVNQGIIKVQANNTAVTNSTIVGIIINHLESQNNATISNINGSSSKLTSNPIINSEQVTTTTNSQQATMGIDVNVCRTDPTTKVTSCGMTHITDPVQVETWLWITGKINDMIWLSQMQNMIDNGTLQILPFSNMPKPLVSITQPIPPIERELAVNALKSRGVDTSGHPTGGVDGNFLIGFLEYLCNEGYASGDCSVIPGSNHILNTTIVDALNNNATINTAKTTTQQWLDNKINDQDLVNQFVALVNNGQFQFYPSAPLPYNPYLSIPVYTSQLMSDWITQSDQSKFNQAIQNLVLNGLLKEQSVASQPIPSIEDAISSLKGVQLIQVLNNMKLMKSQYAAEIEKALNDGRLTHQDLSILFLSNLNALDTLLADGKLTGIEQLKLLSLHFDNGQISQKDFLQKVQNLVNTNSIPIPPMPANYNNTGQLRYDPINGGLGSDSARAYVGYIVRWIGNYDDAQNGYNVGLGGLLNNGYLLYPNVTR